MTLKSIKVKSLRQGRNWRKRVIKYITPSWTVYPNVWSFFKGT